MKGVCIAYAAGPGDIVETFRHWQKGTDDPNQVAVTYSGQFFELCKKLGVKGIALSSNKRADSVVTKDFHVANIPAAQAGRGLRFHIQQARNSVKFIQRSRSLGATVFVVSDATGHWFPFSWFSRSQELIIPSIHCVLWSNFFPLSLARKGLNIVERHFFRHRSTGILCVSEDIERQIQTITGSHNISTKVFTPIYRTGTFDTVSPPPKGENFRVFFAGRLEKSKGIYCLLNIAEHLKSNSIKDIHFDILGDGSEEQQLREKAQELGVQDIFHMHGHCDRPKLLKILGRSHVIVVPTTMEFHEGFNKVVAEGILAGRPVITSSACPALNQLRDAIVEVPPDDCLAYEKAILKLRQDDLLFSRKMLACKKLAGRFYDVNNSWGNTLERLLLRAVPHLG